MPKVKKTKKTDRAIKSMLHDFKCRPIVIRLRKLLFVEGIDLCDLSSSVPHASADNLNISAKRKREVESFVASELQANENYNSVTAKTFHRNSKKSKKEAVITIDPAKNVSCENSEKSKPPKASANVSDTCEASTSINANRQKAKKKKKV